jgi:hypothetical protein
MATNRAAMRRAMLAACGALVLAGTEASAAAAADACPNAEVRQQQGATRLPECRAYEQVSPQQKNGNAAFMGYAPRATGGAFAYLSPGAFSDALSSVGVNYKAERTAGGWVTTALNPPLVGDRNPNLIDGPLIMTLSDDFSRALLQTQFPVEAGEQGTRGGDLYLREPSGAFTWTTGGTTVPAELEENANYAGASGDLRRIVFATERALTPEVTSPATERQLYEWVDGEVKLVSKDANGAPLPGGAWAGSVVFPQSSTPFSRSPEAVSDDGRTIFLTSPPATTTGRVYARVYGEPLVDVGLSQKNPPDPEPLRNTIYRDATPDGAKVLFSSPDALTDGTILSTNLTEGNLYIYDVASGELTNAAPYRNPSAPADEQALGPRFVDALGIADDGSRVYFRSKARLLEGLPVAGGSERHVYRYDVAEDRVTFIGTVGSSEGDRNDDSGVSPNGRYAVLETTRAIDGGTGAGVMNLYLHDAVAGTTTCVTCPSGLAEFNPNGIEYRSANEPFNKVTDDGHVFFSSANGLVPEDANGVADAYMWHAGELHLLSSGIDPAPSIFVGATPDAREAYFLTNESLVGHDIDNGVADVYVARVGGGFTEPVVAPACQTGCRQPSGQPAAPPIGSANLTGAQPEALPARPSARVSRLSRAARARLARGRPVSVEVRVNRAGTLRLTARARLGKRNRVVARDTERAAKAGTERLRLRLSRAARARLARGKALRLTVDVGFTGVREPERLAFTLRTGGDR